MSRCLSLALIALLTWSVPASARRARGLPRGATPTLRQQAARADFVLFGTVVNPAKNPADDERSAVTDLRIEMVVKPGADLQDQKTITLPRHIPIEDKKPNCYLMFFNVIEGRLDAHTSYALESDAAAKYLREVLKLDPKKPADAVQFFYRHLDSPDWIVRGDVYSELAFMKYVDLRKGAAQLSPDVIAASLAKPDRHSAFRELDALLLGHCGKERHAAMLKKEIDTASKEGYSSELHALLSGYALLKPKEGLAFMRDTIRQEKASFHVRYAVLRALRFFADDRPDVFPRVEIVQLLGLLLDHANVADLAVHELRRLGEESVMERVLALANPQVLEHPDPVINIGGAVLRYALTFPKNAKARAYVEQRREADPEAVEAEEEFLKVQMKALKKGE